MPICGGRDHAPIEVERQITEWARAMFGFPSGATGLFVTGTSMANFMAVLVARPHALGAEVRQAGLTTAGPRLTAYASTGPRLHARALDYAGLGSERCDWFPSTRSPHRRGCSARAIATDRLAGLTPFLVVGNAGTVDIGAIDDLAALADIAATNGSGSMSTAPWRASGFWPPDSRRGSGNRARRFDRARFPQMGAGALRRRLPPGSRRPCSTATFAARRPICAMKHVASPAANPGRAISGLIYRAAFAR
jgi:hypothetical protein